MAIFVGASASDDLPVGSEDVDRSIFVYPPLAPWLVNAHGYGLTPFCCGITGAAERIIKKTRMDAIVEHELRIILEAIYEFCNP